MKKMFGILLGLLFCSMGMAQETPPEPTLPSQSATQTKRTSKFQSLWQQRKGHSVCLDYGFQTDLLEYSLYKDLKYTPIRFDLSYQYDIPWNPKRINFYAHAGLSYRKLNIKNIDDLFPYYESYYDGPLAILTDSEKGGASMRASALISIARTGCICRFPKR